MREGATLAELTDDVYPAGVLDRLEVEPRVRGLDVLMLRFAIGSDSIDPTAGGDRGAGNRRSGLCGVDQLLPTAVEVQDALQRALDYLQQAASAFTQTRSGELVAEDLRLAQQELNEITGEFSSDDLLGRIFSSFCIGK